MMNKDKQFTLNEWRCTSVECRYHPIIKHDERGRPLCEGNCPFLNNPEFVSQQSMLEVIIEKKLNNYDEEQDGRD